MPELPDALKNYLPGPLFLALTIFWWVGGDSIKEFARGQFKHPPARIRIENRKNNLHIVDIEITRAADKAFEEVRIQLQLYEKPTDISGELSALDGTRAQLAILSTNKEGNNFFIDRLNGKGPPITLQQRESIEISLHEAPPEAVREVWLNSKDRQPIAASDLNQHWALAEIGWRLVAGLFAVCAFVFLYRLLVRLCARKALTQLEEDIDFLHQCSQADKAALTRFDTELQPIIDAGTGKYLKAFSHTVRESARTTVIPHEIFRRAQSLPQFRRSLKGEVQRFVITFCVEMLEREYTTVKGIAKADRAHIH